MFSCRCRILDRGKLAFGATNYPKANLKHRECWKREIYSRTTRNQKTTERSAGLADTYNCQHADYWNNVWEDRKYFLPKDENGAKMFKMILPPPNVTGVLHLGHALTCTIQDVLARWCRMKGDSVIWIPGLDHAGIATQVVVEKYLANTKGLGRYELGKENFLLSLKEWKEEKAEEIRNQLKTLGASLDWSKEYFTMSEEHNRAVTEALVLLSERGLLYRKKSLINWSPALQSAISDIEIRNVRITGRTDFVVPGYRKKVPFGLMAKVSLKLRDSDERLRIATTRLETMPGDVAIAVHPSDRRYSSFIGREVWHPIRETFIPIIKDYEVKPAFGTGAVKITPGHNRADLDMAKRHNLDVIDVIGNDGNMTSAAKSLEGLGRFVAREKILNQLTEEGALLSLENHEMVVPVCSRTGDIVEYLMREQWFLKTKEMAERAAQAVGDKSLRIDPPEWANVWCDWLDDNRDWCISRQIWWGHRIPAYRIEGGEWIIARNEEEARQRLISKETQAKEKDSLIIEQDQDVLDTWFSSALLPLTSMGWPDQKFEKYYPLSLMETGHDIIFLWVARMVMLGTELTGTLPFKEVLFHGVLCDAQGRKMSKSSGNVIRPEHVINGISLEKLNAEAQRYCKDGILSEGELKKSIAVNEKMLPDGIADCGVDALRLTLCAHNVKNNRVSFNVIECRTNKHFCNKIWQAARFILRTMETSDVPVEKPEKSSTVDRWILSRLSFMVAEVNECFEKRNFHKAVQAIRQFFHYEFCDFFLEAAKAALKNEGQAITESHRYSLSKCLEVSLRILAPLTPYLSEELYHQCAQKLPGIFSSLPSIVESSYPTFDGEFETLRDPELEKIFDRILDVVHAVRNVLPQVGDKSDSEVLIVTDVPAGSDHYADNLSFIKSALRVKNIKVLSSRDYVAEENSVLCGSVGSECRVFLRLANETDAANVIEKMEKKRLRSQKKLENLLRRSGLPKLADESESEKLRDQEQIKSLEKELKRYPKIL